MNPLTYLDDVGITVFFRPMYRLHDAIHDFNMLNLFDDIGIFLVCKPLRYLERFAEFLCDVERDADERVKGI